MSVTIDHTELFDSFPAPAVIVDRDTRVVAANAEIARLFRVAPEDLVGTPILERFPPNPSEPDQDRRADLLHLVRDALTSGAAHVVPLARYDLLMADGSYVERYWSAVISPLRRHGAPAEHAVLRIDDITDFVRENSLGTAPHPLRRRTDTLGSDVFARARYLQNLNDDLRRANEELAAAGSDPHTSDESLERILATLAHEVRNPLASIRGALDVLRDGSTGASGAIMVGVIERQVNALTRITDDLLDVSRARVGKLELDRRPLELGALAASVVEGQRMSGTTSERSLELSIRGEVWVSGDPDRLAQALSNVLGNAIKFTDPSGTVTVHVEQVGSHGVLTVSDDGRGFDPARAAELFEPFAQQREANEPGERGLGLGLAISRSIIETHGGTMMAASDGPQAGATFTIRLPLAPQPRLRAVELPADATPADTTPADTTPAGAPPADTTPAGATRTAVEPEPEPAPEPRTQHTLRVLLIEDSAEIASAIRAPLEQQGYDVEVLGSAADGIEAAIRDRPEIIICEIGLPDIDGYGVARRLRTIPSLGGTPIIAVSSYARADDRARAFASGFEEFLVKPFTEAAVNDALARVTDPRNRPARQRD